MRLDGIRPHIWRRFLVPAEVTLANLHLVLQAVMGWEDSHLYAFEVGGRRIGRVFRDLGDSMEDAARVRLRTVAGKVGDRLMYLYDFGDSWHHHLLVEKVLSDGDARPMVCLSGRRACPPEDCGGVWGYHSLTHPEDLGHDDRIDWLDEVHGPYDPEHFDPSEVTKRLQRIDPFAEARARPTVQIVRRGGDSGS